MRLSLTLMLTVLGLLCGNHRLYSAYAQDSDVLQGVEGHGAWSDIVRGSLETPTCDFKSPEDFDYENLKIAHKNLQPGYDPVLLALEQSELVNFSQECAEDSLRDFYQKVQYCLMHRVRLLSIQLGKEPLFLRNVHKIYEDELFPVAVGVKFQSDYTVIVGTHKGLFEKIESLKSLDYQKEEQFPEEELHRMINTFLRACIGGVKPVERIHKPKSFLKPQEFMDLQTRDLKVVTIPLVAPYDLCCSSKDCNAFIMTLYANDGDATMHYLPAHVHKTSAINMQEVTCLKENIRAFCLRIQPDKSVKIFGCKEMPPSGSMMGIEALKRQLLPWAYQWFFPSSNAMMGGQNAWKQDCGIQPGHFLESSYNIFVNALYGDANGFYQASFRGCNAKVVQALSYGFPIYQPMDCDQYDKVWPYIICIPFLDKCVAVIQSSAFIQNTLSAILGRHSIEGVPPLASKSVKARIQDLTPILRGVLRETFGQHVPVEVDPQFQSLFVNHHIQVNLMDESCIYVPLVNFCCILRRCRARLFRCFQLSGLETLQQRFAENLLQNTMLQTRSFVVVLQESDLYPGAPVDA